MRAASHPCAHHCTVNARLPYLRLISEDLRFGEQQEAQRTLACALTLAVAAGTLVAVLLEVGGWAS